MISFYFNESGNGIHMCCEGNYRVAGAHDDVETVFFNFLKLQLITFKLSI